MKVMQVYRSSFPSYEGAVVVEDNGTLREKARGYFEAVQAPDGQIAIGCFFPGGMWGNAEQDIRNNRLRFYTRDGGWTLRTDGAIQVLSRGLYGFMYEVVIRAARLRVERQSQRQERTYASLKFAIANLILGEGNHRIPERFYADFQGDWLLFEPVRDYAHRIALLQSVGGVQHTVDVVIGKRDEDGQDLPVGKSMAEAVELMADLVPVLCLWSGSKVNWLFAEGFNHESYPSEVVHQNPVVGGYSDITIGYEWTTRWIHDTDAVPLHKLVGAASDGYGNTLSKQIWRVS